MSDTYPGQLARQDDDPYDPWRRAAARVRSAAQPWGGRQGDPDRMGELASAPLRAVAGFVQAAYDRAAEEHGGATQLSTDYDPRRLGALLGTETAMNVVGTPATPAGALGAGARDPRLWSPISTQKLSKPLAEMEHRYTDVRTPVPKFVRPEDMVGGILVPTPSDLSRGNRTLTHVDTQKLERPVTAHGGVSFPEANPGQAWASEQAIARRLDNQAARLAETGKPVYIAPMTMSPQSIDASHHVADPLSQLVKHAPIKRADVAAFNEMMRKEVPDWVSIKSPKFDQYINGLEGGMTIKALMADRMATAQWQSKGFPNVAAVRHAMSEPALIDQPRNTMGMAISRYTPGKGLLETSHPSYGKGVAGEHMGQLASLVPFKDIAYDIAGPLAAKNAANKAAGKKVNIEPAYHLGRPTEGIPTHQVLDDQWLERMMKRLENKAKGQ